MRNATLLFLRAAIRVFRRLASSTPRNSYETIIFNAVYKLCAQLGQEGPTPT